MALNNIIGGVSGPISGNDITLDSSNFSNALSSLETTPQKAFEKLDTVVGKNISDITTINVTINEIDINFESKEDKINKITTWQTTPDDTHYPSEKLVKEEIDNINTKIGDIDTALNSILGREV